MFTFPFLTLARFPLRSVQHPSQPYEFLSRRGTHQMCVGTKEDVQLVRTGARQLTVKGDVKAGSLDVKKLTVDGKQVNGGNLESMLQGVFAFALLQHALYDTTHMQF